MNDFTVHKAEGMDAILDCVSSPNGIIALDEKDVRELIGISETAIYITERAQNVSDIKIAVSNALEKLCSTVKIEKLTKLIFKVASCENLSMSILKDIAEFIVSKCDEDANILWSYECSPGLGEAINIILLIPASSKSRL